MERVACVFLAFVNVGFGVAVLVGGAVRFPPPTYEPLLALTGGQVWPYGAAYLVSGILLAHCGSLWARLVGCGLSVAAHSTFTALFLVAVLKYPDAGATAWWAYLVFALQSATLGALLWTHRGR